jgi:polyferredoxin
VIETKSTKETPPSICKVCGMENCTMHAGITAGTEVPGDASGVHTMAGIPPYLAAGGLVLIILVSHFILSRRWSPRPKTSWRFNLFGLPGVESLVRRPAFPMAMQRFSIFLFVLVLATGFFGSQRVNIGPVLTWTWWWALLIFFVLFLGKAFCTICPWEGISSIVSSVSLSSRIKALGFELRWPRKFRNIYPAMLLFILLTWFELGMDITRSPMLTAVMGLAFVSLAVITALVFERRAFCRYLCLVGRIQGIYALFSPVELRPHSTEVCRTCAGKECYRGSETAVGCPTSLFPGALKENTYCTLCTECVRSCPEDNIRLNLRPFASDLLQKSRFRSDEAVLAVVLLALTSFHGLTMTPDWTRMTGVLRADLGLGAVPVFTLLMTLMILAPIVMFWGAAWLSRRIGSVDGISVGKTFKLFAYSVIPIALFYHLAHNSMHFFMEAQHIVPLLSDPFGWGWDLFGTAGRRYPPLTTLKTIWWIQISLIVAGHFFGVLVADRMAMRLYPDRGAAVRSLVPLIVTMILYSSFSVWLIAQPMEMRSGM